jgi:hypothetical protein
MMLVLWRGIVRCLCRRVQPASTQKSCENRNGHRDSSQSRSPFELRKWFTQMARPTVPGIQPPRGYVWIVWHQLCVIVSSAGFR